MDRTTPHRALARARPRDPEHQDRDGFAPLHFASPEGSLEVLRLLLDRGAAVDAVNRFGNTPLIANHDVAKHFADPP